GQRLDERLEDLQADADPVAQHQRRARPVALADADPDAVAECLDPLTAIDTGPAESGGSAGPAQSNSVEQRQAGSCTYVPGAGHSAGWLALPRAVGAGFSSPARAMTQSAQWSHQVPSCRVLAARHSSASGPGVG